MAKLFDKETKVGAYSPVNGEMMPRERVKDDKGGRISDSYRN